MVSKFKFKFEKLIKVNNVLSIYYSGRIGAKCGESDVSIKR